jgi:hypothetical protein
VATSSAEAEYIGQVNAVRQAIHLCQLMNEIHILIERPIYITADNESAIVLSKNPEFHARIKHTNVVYHFQRDKV